MPKLLHNPDALDVAQIRHQDVKQKGILLDFAVVVQHRKFLCPPFSVWVPLTRERPTQIALSTPHFCPPPDSPEPPKIKHTINFGEFVFFAGWLRHRGAAYCTGTIISGDMHTRDRCVGILYLR